MTLFLGSISCMTGFVAFVSILEIYEGFNPSQNMYLVKGIVSKKESNTVKGNEQYWITLKILNRYKYNRDMNDFFETEHNKVKGDELILKCTRKDYFNLRQEDNIEAVIGGKSLSLFKLQWVSA